MLKQGTLGLSIYRALIALLSFGIPTLITGYPTIANMTISTILFGLLHYAETKAPQQ